MSGEITDALREIYKKAQGEGIWIYELTPGGREGQIMYVAAAGSVQEIEELEKKLGKEIDIKKLSLGEIVALSEPRTGNTREEACENAIKAYKKYNKTRK